MKQQEKPIELRHLNYFNAVSEHRSFRRAAIAIGVSQSVISRSIADLEDRIGASLFHRHYWGVSETDAGLRFLFYVRKALSFISEGVSGAASIGRAEEGRVRIGIYSSLATGFLAQLLDSYNRQHSKVSLEIFGGNARELVSAVRSLRLDIAFVTGKQDWVDCEHEHLWSERIFLALPSNHTLTANQTIEWKSLFGEFFVVSEEAPGQEVYNHLVRSLSEPGRHPNIQVQRVSRDNLLHLVANGHGLTLVGEPLTTIKFPGVEYRPINGECLPFSAVWSTSNDNPAFRRLLSAAKVVSKSRQAES
jgi:Transcriptional regulator